MVLDITIIIIVKTQKYNVLNIVDKSFLSV